MDGVHKVNEINSLNLDTDSYTELLKGDQIGKIPTYIEETDVLLHTPKILLIIQAMLRRTGELAEGRTKEGLTAEVNLEITTTAGRLSINEM